MLLISIPSQAQFGKFLNKAKEKAKESIKEEAKISGTPESAASAEATEDLPPIYSIAKSNYTYGPDSPLEEVLTLN